MNARELLDLHALTISDSGAAYCGDFIRNENDESWCGWFWSFDATADDHERIRKDFKEHLIEVLDAWKNEGTT